MQFITTDQRIAVENFEIGLIYTVTFTSGSYFLGACIGKGANYVMFQRTAPELIFSLTMAAAADVASIDPLGSDIGKILEYTGSVPVSIKTNGSPLLEYTIKGNDIPGTGDKTANLFDTSILANNKSLNSSGVVIDSAGRTATITPIDVSNYTSVTLSYTSNSISFMFATFNGTTLVERTAAKSSGATIDVTNCDTLYISFYKASSITTDDVTEIMLNSGSTALPYEPFGVKIPILSGDTTTNIYLDNPLRKSLDGTAVDELSSNGKLTQRVDTDGSVLSTPIISYIDIPTIPTTDGLNIFDIDTTVKPSEVYLKYFSPLL